MSQFNASAVSLTDRRRHRRYAVSGHIEASLQRKESGLPVTFMPLDVSKSGLGLIVAEQINYGEILELNFKNDTIPNVVMKVCWAFSAEDDPLAEDMYRCGLQVINTNQDLETILRNMETVMLDDMG